MTARWSSNEETGQPLGMDIGAMDQHVDVVSQPQVNARESL